MGILIRKSTFFVSWLLLDFYAVSFIFVDLLDVRQSG